MLSEETIIFLTFVTYGLLISVIFDIFRALRKVQKKVTTKIVLIQDIVYIIFITVLLVFFMYKHIKTDLRVYLILASILGVIIYYSLFGNIIRNIFEKIIRLWKVILEFIFITIEPYNIIFNKYIKKIVKIVEKCCKKYLYMINSKYNILKTNTIKLYKREEKFWKQKFQMIKQIKNLRTKNIK